MLCKSLMTSHNNITVIHIKTLEGNIQYIYYVCVSLIVFQNSQITYVNTYGKFWNNSSFSTKYIGYNLHNKIKLVWQFFKVFYYQVSSKYVESQWRGNIWMDRQTDIISKLCIQFVHFMQRTYKRQLHSLDLHTWCEVYLHPHMMR